MVELVISLLKTARPRQWLKNGSLAAALIFSGRLFEPESFWITVWAVVVFSILASSVYFMNDIVDLKKDRLHPFKKLRPIASGKLPVGVAVLVVIAGVFVSLYLASTISFFFFLICLVYFAFQVLYSIYLKNQIVVDVMAIAVSFILRIYAGAVVLNYHISIWFLLCVTSLALFMAVGKRRSELALLLNTKDASALNHRHTLVHYTADLLDDYLSMFAGSAWMSWALFTFFESPPVGIISPRWLMFLPQTISGTNKLLMITVPVVIYGIMRYMNIIYQGSRAESPERVLLSDRPLLATVGIWGILVVWIIYGVG